MTLYTARVLSSQGGVSVLSIDANSVDAARRHPALARSQVLSVRRHWSEWLGLRQADLNEQRLLLTRMAMQLTRGQLTSADVDQIVQRLPSLKRNRKGHRATNLTGLAPHEILLQLNCHPFVIALCREGERLGQVPEMLLQAANFLSQQHQTRQQLRAPLMKSALYFTTALILLIVVPFLFQMLLNRLEARVVIETTLATDLLMGLHTALTDYLPLTLALITAVGVAGNYYWEQIRILPVLRDIDLLIRSQRSAVLLAILAPAFRKGVHLAELVRSLHPLLGRRASQHLHFRLTTGHRLSQSLSQSYFSETLSVGLHQFEDVPSSQLPRLFDTVQSNLDVEIHWRLDRIVRFARWLYTGLLLGLLLLLIQGFLVPIYSIGVA